MPQNDWWLLSKFVFNSLYVFSPFLLLLQSHVLGGAMVSQFLKKAIKIHKSPMFTPRHCTQTQVSLCLHLDTAHTGNTAAQGKRVDAQLSEISLGMGREVRRPTIASVSVDTKWSQSGRFWKLSTCLKIMPRLTCYTTRFIS